MSLLVWLREVSSLSPQEKQTFNNLPVFMAKKLWSVMNFKFPDLFLCFLGSSSSPQSKLIFWQILEIFWNSWVLLLVEQPDYLLLFMAAPETTEAFCDLFFLVQGSKGLWMTSRLCFFYWILMFVYEQLETWL